MGDVTLQNFLTAHDLLPKLHTETDLYVILLGDDVYEQSVGVIAKLRQEGVRVAVDSSGRKFDKQIKAADKKGIGFVMVIGDTELASGQFPLKNLATGEQEAHGIDRIASLVLAARR
jgi:histidyl-tRNA synthetase